MLSDHVPCGTPFLPPFIMILRANEVHKIEAHETLVWLEQLLRALCGCFRWVFFEGMGPAGGEAELGKGPEGDPDPVDDNGGPWQGSISDVWGRIKC